MNSILTKCKNENQLDESKYTLLKIVYYRRFKSKTFLIPKKLSPDIFFCCNNFLGLGRYWTCPNRQSHYKTFFGIEILKKNLQLLS